MNMLYLLRHAKAAPASNGVSDFERPLDSVGHHQAEALGLAMRSRQMTPVTILCSPARRTRETLDRLALGPGARPATFADLLFTATVNGYLDAIHELTGCSSLMVVGHNPMIQDLAALLTTEEDRAAYRSGFGTGALAVLGFERDMDMIAPGEGHLLAFLDPTTF